MYNILKTTFVLFLFIYSVPLLAETTQKTENPTTSSSDTTREQMVDVPANEQAIEEEKEPEQYYTVEVILFQHLNEEGKLDEFWHVPETTTESFNDESKLANNLTLAAEPVVTDDIPALAQYDLTRKRFQPLRNGIAALPETNYKLAESAAHLRYSKSFQLLAHFGWTQRSLSLKDALPIQLTTEQFSDSLIPTGQLQLYVSRYLHLQVDLSASRCEETVPAVESNIDSADSASADIASANIEQQPEQNVSATNTSGGDNTNRSDVVDQQNLDQQSMALNAETAMENQCLNNTYLFKQQRKMRSKELHYLDNPVYGLLVYVTPYTTEGETTE